MLSGSPEEDAHIEQQIRHCCSSHRRHTITEMVFGCLPSAKAVTFIDTVAAVTSVKLTVALNTVLSTMNPAL